jgi:hypothetical protein
VLLPEAAGHPTAAEIRGLYVNICLLKSQSGENFGRKIMATGLPLSGLQNKTEKRKYIGEEKREL